MALAAAAGGGLWLRPRGARAAEGDAAPLLVVIQVTLALSFIVQSAIHLAFTSNFVTVQSVLSGKAIQIAGASIALTSLLPFFVAILLIVAFVKVKKRDAAYGRGEGFEE